MRHITRQGLAQYYLIEYLASSILMEGQHEVTTLFLSFFYLWSCSSSCMTVQRRSVSTQAMLANKLPYGCCTCIVKQQFNHFPVILFTVNRVKGPTACVSMTCRACLDPPHVDIYQVHIGRRHIIDTKPAYGLFITGTIVRQIKDDQR